MAQHADVHRLLVVRLQVVSGERGHGGVGDVEIAVSVRYVLQDAAESVVRINLLCLPSRIRLWVLSLERRYHKRREHVVAVDNGVLAKFLYEITHNWQRRARKVQKRNGSGVAEGVHCVLVGIAENVRQQTILVFYTGGKAANVSNRVSSKYSQMHSEQTRLVPFQPS